MADNSPPRPGAGDDSAAGLRWMWWSTHESIAAEVPSVWAIVETVLAVAAYWWVAIWFGTYAFLFAGVIIAPMVLLRSNASVALGLQWFKRFEEQFDYEASARMVSAVELAPFLLGGIAAVATSFSFCLWLKFLAPYSVFFDDPVPYAAFFGGFGTGALGLIVGLAAGLALAQGVGKFGPTWLVLCAAVGAIAGVAEAGVAGAGVWRTLGAVTIASSAASGVALLELWPTSRARAFFFFSWGFYLGVFPFALSISLFVVSALIRTSAVLWHLPEGFFSMPRNFRRVVLSTSPLQMPELIPGIATTDSRFRFDHFVRRLDWQDRAVYFIVLLAYIPAWLYRLSIKSTAWFWWPLAYIGREPLEARDPDHMRRLVLGSPFRRLGRRVAITSLVAFAALSAWDPLRRNGLHLPPLPTQTLVIGFVLTRLGEVPWQFAGLLSAAAALLAGMWTGHAAISLDHAKDPAVRDAAERQFVWIERLARFGFVCTILYWLGLGGHLALYANSQRCWIEPPPAVSAWATKLYGDLAPPPPHCGP